AGRRCSRSTCTCWPARRWAGSASRPEPRNGKARLRRAFPCRPRPSPPPAPPPPGRRGEGTVIVVMVVVAVLVLATGPEVDHVRSDPRETVVVLADAAGLVALDPAGEGDLAVLLEHGRVVET